jgi:deleted-in-malignant-brain-tumors protein 1
VVCKQLGFSPHGALAVSGEFFGEGELSVFFDRANCDGTESSLLECNYTSMPVSCDRLLDAGVVCQATATEYGNCTHGALRLEGGNITEGRVEICINNAWGTVCSDSYGSRDAKVICQQLGFDTAGAQPLRGSRAAAFGSGSGPIFLSQLDCLGDETSLLDCPTFSPPGLHDCDHTQDAGVRCIDINQCLENNGNCSQLCRNRVPDYVCDCRDGYALDPDNFTCSDIDECLTDNGGCSQNCTNTDGGYICECLLPGYDVVDVVNCSSK